ncbi:Predicted arabinose efflux permease, MFS family [Evansella caseinilytica]|uniref:Predicted arabinose efflux permease, MFS family n=1 Tax=Evansella caseinilytica TaxID=1503961 RepID=A0A1H3TP36_9BACI|nr:MFS transporter [Evansella caseinilytica]SDZ51581.1 Predicted arabinose efflux permease, MFS family [Evansella caseinilytica]
MERTKSTFILYLVCISAFFASLNQNIYSPIITLVRDSFDVSLTLVNLSVSLFIFVTAILQIIYGSLVDVKGARFVLLPGLILTVAASIGCAVTTNFTLFMIFRVLQAIGTAAIPLIAATTIARLFQGNQRGSAMGTYQMLLSVAPIIAPVLGGFIGDQYSYPGIFWFLAGVAAILLLTNVLYFPADPPEDTTTVRIGKLLTHYVSIFQNKTGQSILSLSFFLFLVYFAIIVYLPVLLTESYQLSLKIVGLLYLPMAVSTMAGSIIFKYVQSKLSLKKLFIYGNGLAAGSIVLFAVTNAYSLIGLSIALVLYGVTIGLMTPLYATMITDEFESNRGSAMGMFNFIRYIGMAAGPVFSGLLLATLDSFVAFGFLGGLYAVLSFFLLFRMNRRKEGSG